MGSEVGWIVVSYLPCRAVSSCLIDELRCKMDLGVVRPRVVLWVILEWTRGLVVDRDVDRG